MINVLVFDFPNNIKSFHKYLQYLQLAQFSFVSIKVSKNVLKSLSLDIKNSRK